MSLEEEVAQFVADISDDDSPYEPESDEEDAEEEVNIKEKWTEVS